MLYIKTKKLTKKEQDLCGLQGIFFLFNCQTPEPDVVVELDEELKTQAVVKPEEDNQVQRAVEVVKDEIGEANPG